MWTQIKETVAALGGCIIFLIVLAGLCTVLNGCSSNHQTKGPSFVKPTKMYAHKGKCKTLGLAKSSHAAVLVARCHWKRRTTVINVLVLKPHRTKRTAQEHTYRLIKSILGFVPPHMYLFMGGKIKKMPFYMLIVGEPR